MTQSTLNLTTHPSRRSGNSQKSRLLELLKDGEYHDFNEILNVVYRVSGKVGRANIPARVYDLRKDGHMILTDDSTPLTRIKLEL